MMEFVKYVIKKLGKITGSRDWTWYMISAMVSTVGGSIIKTGERNEFGGRRRYIFHNTALQPNGAQHAFSSHVNPNCITRNNIFGVP